MLQLFTLGELRLAAEDGALLSRRRTPLVLLAYLARRAPRSVPRVELASLLWGERTEVKARHSLRQALFDLHRLVGDRLEVSPLAARLSGPDVAFDVELFERDVDAGRDADAVARWQGDFLADASNDDATALRVWLDAERAGLRRRLTLAFDRLLDSAERRGATRDAVTIARRWGALAPLDEHACQRLIATLRRAGEAADALSAHAQFTARVREAFDVEPTRGFVALATSLDDAARDDSPLLGDRNAAVTPRSATALPLVGRASVIGMLDRAWQLARGGAPVVVILVGEHGMGATRLAQELVRRVRESDESALVLHGDTSRRVGIPSTPYSGAGVVFHDLESAAALGGLSTEMLGVLARAIPALSVRFARHARLEAELTDGGVAAATQEAIEAAAEDAPVAVIADALSEADAESRELVATLVERVRGPVLFALGVRPDDTGRGVLTRLCASIPSARVIMLEPLSVDDIATVLDATAALPAEERDALAHAIHLETSGIPLYTITTIQSLVDERLLTLGDAEHSRVMARLGGRELAVPAQVRSDVQRRLHALDANAQRAVEAAAVLSAPFTAADIARLTGATSTDTIAALASAARAGLIRVGESASSSTISPRIVERALYALVPPLRRDAFHAAAATLLAESHPWYGLTGDRSRAAYHRARVASVTPRRTGARWWIGAVATTVLVLVAAALFLRPNSSPAHTGERTVAIFPFAVHGDTNVAYLRTGMVDLLSTSLDGAGGFHTIDPRVLLAATPATSATDSLTPDRARALAARLGATHFVLGTVVGAAGGLRVGVALYDVRRGADAAARASAEGDESALFGIVDRVTAELAVVQGAGSDARLAQLAARTTTSLVALKAYLEGRSAYRTNDLYSALPAFERALAADSSFALAWYGLATTASWMLRPDLEQHAAAQAVRHDGRLSDRDRTLVQAFAAYTRGAADSAERMAISIVERYDDIEGWVLLGEILYHHNWKRGRSLAESRHAWQRVLILDPTYWPALQHLAEVAAVEGRAAEADSLLALYERSVGPAHMMMASRALRAFAFGDSASRASLAPALAADRGFFVILSVWYVAVLGRDIPGAQELARLLVTPLRPPAQQGFGRVLLAHLALARGRWSEARAELAIARVHAPNDALEYQLLLSLAPFVATPASELTRQRTELFGTALPAPDALRTLPWPDTHGPLHRLLRAYLAGMASARTGDEVGRGESLAALAALPDPTGSVALGQGYARSIEAEDLLRRGHPAATLAALERGVRTTPFVAAWTSSFVSQAYERYMHAEVLHALGRDDEALRWYETLGENSPYDLVYLAPSLYRQAQIYDARGEATLAIARYARVIELWKDCDPELRPFTIDATARLARLR